MDSESLKELRKLEKPSKTLFVRNINYSTTEQDLRDAFQKYGRLEEVFSRVSTRGMAFITFSTLAEAENALKNLQNTNIRDRPVDIHYSVSREDANKQQAHSGHRGRREEQAETSLIVTLRGCENFTTDEAKEFFSTYGKLLSVRETSGRDKKIILDFENERDCKEARRLCDGMGYKNGYFNIKFANNDRRRSPTRRGRDRRRDRDYSTPYQRRHDSRDHQMSDRPIRSGVNHMIQDLASTIQQHAQGNHPNHYNYPPGSYYPPPERRDYPPEYRERPPPYYNDYPPRDYRPPQDPYYQQNPPYPPYDDPRGHPQWHAPPGPGRYYDERPYYPPDTRYNDSGPTGPAAPYPPSSYRSPDPRSQGNINEILHNLQSNRSNPNDPRMRNDGRYPPTENRPADGRYPPTGSRAAEGRYPTGAPLSYANQSDAPNSKDKDTKNTYYDFRQGGNTATETQP